MPTPDEVVTLLVIGDWRNVTPCADGAFSGRFDDIAGRLAAWMERRTFGPPADTSDDVNPLKELRDAAVVLSGKPKLPSHSPAGLFGWATPESIAQVWVPQPDQSARDAAERVAAQILQVCRREERYIRWLHGLIDQPTFAKRHAVTAAAIEQLVWVDHDPLRRHRHPQSGLAAIDLGYSEILRRARSLYSHVFRTEDFQLTDKVLTGLRSGNKIGRDAVWDLALTQLRQWPPPGPAPDCQERLPFRLAQMAARGQLGYSQQPI